MYNYIKLLLVKALRERCKTLIMLFIVEVLEQPCPLFSSCVWHVTYTILQKSKVVSQALGTRYRNKEASRFCYKGQIQAGILQHLSKSQFYTERFSIIQQDRYLANNGEWMHDCQLLIMLDPSCIIFLQASTGGKQEHLYKVLVIGDLGTGKTSIIKRYVHQFFSPHYRATVSTLHTHTHTHTPTQIYTRCVLYVYSLFYCFKVVRLKADLALVLYSLKICFEN